MNNWKSIIGSASIATLMGSTAAFADVTANEVWADWQSYLTDYGYEISSVESVTSDGVTVTDLVMTMDMPKKGDEDSDDKITVNFGTMTLKNQGDGTVAIVLPAHMPMAITVGDEFAATLNYDTTGMSMIVSGDANEMTYAYTIDQADISLADLVIKGDKIDDATIKISMSNVVGKSVSIMGDLRQMTQNIATDMIRYDVAITHADLLSMTVKGSIADLVINSDSFIPKDVDLTDMAAALNAGFSSKGGLTWGAGGYEFTSTNNDREVTGKSASDSGSLNFGMDRDSLNYGGTANGAKASFTSPDLPFPVEISIAEGVFNILMPIGKTETPSDFALTIKLGDFSINDEIWNMFDLGAVLPRDPATILLDFDGKANLLVDIMNPEAMKTSDIEMPAQLHELTLKSLQVTAAGAELTGTGAFTFNNDDLETFGGLPAPTGAVDLKLTGGNGLMDNLVEMGLLPADQAMGARMMMGLFAVVGEGEDTLTSKIEVTGDGHVLANGQRLK